MTATTSTYGGLPPIPNYDPKSIEWDDLNRVHWRADARRAALLIHDMQSYYVDALPDGAAEPLIATISQLRDMCSQLGIPVIYSVAAPCKSRAERGLLADFHGMGMQDREAHYQIDPRLQPRADDGVVTKKIYSAFYSTPLQAIMQKLGKDQIIISGVYADIGCQLTAFDAFKRGIEVFYVADAMLAYSREEHIQAAQYVARLCSAVYQTSTVIAQLTKAQF